MDNLVEVITPSGFKVYLKPFLSFSDKRQIQKVWASGISVNAQTKQENADLNGGVIYEAQDLTLKLMVKKLITKEGRVFEGTSAFDVLMGEDFPEEDGNAILNKVDELSNANQLSEEAKKKFKMQPSDSTKQEEV